MENDRSNNMEVASEWGREFETFSEAQNRNKELQVAKKELELRELQEDTKKSLASVGESMNKQ